MFDAVELFRCHSNDSDRRPVHDECSADDARVAAEPLLPHVKTDDRDRMRSRRSILIWCEAATPLHPDADEVEEGAADDSTANADRCATGGK